MSDREKLIAIIREKENWLPQVGTLAGQTLRLADHLIANGVTFATDTNVGDKWISAKTPPKDWKGEGGYLTNYYVYTPDYGVDIGNYMGAANRWLCMGMPCNVTHWMPLPEAPKEE